MNCLFESSSHEITGTKGRKKAIAIGGPSKPSLVPPWKDRKGEPGRRLSSIVDIYEGMPDSQSKGSGTLCENCYGAE
jgi:hypothetical protein